MAIMTEQSPTGQPSAPGQSVPESDAVLARRAQILATEHWGLLAARSTAQSEVLTRITIFLTLVSAALVTIGVVGQASGFAGWFAPAALALLGFVCLVGVITQIRVMNVSEEDMMYVVAMNRLRSAYVDLDPAIESVFLSATADDMDGMVRTYSFLRRRGASQILGSSAMLLFVVNGCALGLFVGALCSSVGATTGFAIGVGAVSGLLLLAGSTWHAGWTFHTTWKRYVPRRRSSVPPAHLRD